MNCVKCEKIIFSAFPDGTGKCCWVPPVESKVKQTRQRYYASEQERKDALRKRRAESYQRCKERNGFSPAQLASRMNAEHARKNKVSARRASLAHMTEEERIEHHRQACKERYRQQMGVKEGEFIIKMPNGRYRGNGKNGVTTPELKYAKVYKYEQNALLWQCRHGGTIIPYADEFEAQQMKGEVK